MPPDQKFLLLKVKDRKLGDEWSDWQGTIEDFEKNTHAGKRIFLGVLLGTIFLGSLFSFLVWYMVTPRLSQFHALLPKISGILLLCFWCFMALWFFFMMLSILTGKDFFMRLGGKEFSITFLVPLVLRFGRQLGISKDRMGNSYVKVSNTLIRTTAQKIKPEKLLILLPRCLQKSLAKKIISFSKYWKIPVYTVPGGEKARQVVTKTNPSAIIGVACERDLLSGIQDIIDKIPVLGIPNRRPEGPCKNTVIDIVEFEAAVQTFLGADVRLAPIGDKC